MKTETAAILILSALGALIYSNTFAVPFHFDDYTWIVDNSVVHIKGITIGEIKGIFSADRPVAILTFSLNYYLNGLDVRGYHAVNMAVHILGAFGLFLFSNVTLSTLDVSRERSVRVSLFASAIWLSNPINTQAVTYIVQRMTGLGAMFYVYSLFFYAKGRSSGGRGLPYLLLSIFSALMAFGSKQNTFTLPFFMLLYEIFIIRKGDMGIIRQKGFYIPVVAATALFLATVFFLYPEAFKAIFFPYKGVLSVIKERLYTQAVVLSHYLSLYVFPVSSRFSVEYDIPLSRTLFDPPATSLAVGMVVLAVAAAVFLIRRSPFYCFFVLWVIGNMAIESLNIGLAAMYEHRMYLPGMGLAVIAGRWTMDRMGDRRLTLLLSILLVLAFSVNTYLRNNAWRDPVTLWSDSVRKAPYSVTARTNLGLSLLGASRMEEGISELKIARSINPRDPEVRYHLGVAFYEWKVYDMAINEFRTVWDMGFDSPVGRPTIDSYFMRMARSFLAHGNIERGRELLSEARKFHPENVPLREFLEKLENGKLTDEDLRPERW